MKKDEIKYKNDLLYSISATLKRVNALAFANIHLTLKLLGTLSLTTCECEGHFRPLEVLKHGTEAQ